MPYTYGCHALDEHLYPMGNRTLAIASVTGHLYPMGNITLA
ncbi:MAG: hypothetical protein AB4352_09490 [Hormoscilla sp.]